MAAPQRPIPIAAILAPLALAACGSADGEAGAEPWFVEEAQRSGLDFTHVPYFEQRFDFPEIMGAGVGLLDYDRDGWLDVYLVQSGDLDPGGRPLPGDQLFRNRGDGTFEDVTSAAGLRDSGYGMGCACGDYDGDGDTDIFVTNVGPDALYRNEGDGTFRDVAVEAGVAEPGWSTSAAFSDYDADGDLDLFVVRYIHWSHERERDCSFPSPSRDYCSPTVYQAPAASVLYRNRGDGSFEDVSAAAGLERVLGNGLGVVAGDLDGDGLGDFYVANDLTANVLWLHQGPTELRDAALFSGCALSGTGFAASGMGVQAVDVENDGDLDLFVTNLRGQTNTFFRNDGGLYSDATARMGLAGPSQPFTGFGLGFADFDHDGDLDLFVANGHVIREEPVADPADPYAQENLLFEQRAPLSFAEVTPRGGVRPRLINCSRGAAFGDLDNDGDVDVLVVNRGARAHLLRNRIGARGHWVQFQVLDHRGSEALGARLRLRARGREQWRWVATASSYCSSNDPRVHFGLGPASVVDEVAVRWPDGALETWGSLPADRIHTLRRGQGSAGAAGR